MRLGGDEFAVLFTGESMDEAGAGKYAQALRADFEKPVQIDDLAWQLKLDTGILLYSLA